jgi:hypothetical protein
MLRLPIPLSRFQGSRQLGSLLSTGDEAASIGVATLGGLHSLEVEYLFGRPYIIARGLLSSPEAGGIRLKELYSSRFPTTMARDMFVENVMERLRTFTTLLLTAPSAIHVALLQCACENALRSLWNLRSNPSLLGGDAAPGPSNWREYVIGVLKRMEEDGVKSSSIRRSRVLRSFRLFRESFEHCHAVCAKRDSFMQETVDMECLAPVISYCRLVSELANCFLEIDEVIYVEPSAV